MVMMMMMMMALQERLGVSRISLSVTTMDDVFLKIGEMIEAKVSLVDTILDHRNTEKGASIIQGALILNGRLSSGSQCGSWWR